MIRPILFVFLVALTCRDVPKEETSTASSIVVPAAPGATSNGPSDCPHTGRWAACSIERRLRQAGFVAKRINERAVRRSGFSVTPISYSLGRARLDVFIYDDTATLAREMAAIDATRATLIRSGNLAAVYTGDNPQQAERLTLAITAGAPQPGSPR